MNTENLPTYLEDRLSECFEVIISEGGDPEITILPEFYLDDCNTFPIFLQRLPDGWQITDYGFTISRLFCDEEPFTENILAETTRLVEHNAAQISETHEITMQSDGKSVYAQEIIKFIILIAQIQGLAALSRPIGRSECTE